MSALEVGPKRFGRRCQEKAKELLELAGGLPDRPSPDEIHDVRVSARRMQVMRRLLPRRIRSSQTSRRFDLLLRSALKRTSQLRDLDTLTSTLKEHRTSLPANLFVTLENQRSDAAARARGALDLLADAPPPDIDPSEIRGRRLSKRLRKKVREHGQASVRLLSDVLSDESKVEELHTLRKEVKKLRYLLELSKDAPPELEVVTRWQESLGAVHDLDVAMQYLQGRDFELKGRAIDELHRSRHQSYLRFIGGYRVDSMESLGDSTVLFGGPTLQPI